MIHILIIMHMNNNITNNNQCYIRIQRINNINITTNNNPSESHKSLIHMIIANGIVKVRITVTGEVIAIVNLISSQYK